MTYAIISPPFTLKFREMPKKELVAYATWFHSIMPERTRELTSAVKSTPGFENWQADFSPDSLITLGDWFLAHVTTRKRTDEDLREIKSRLTFPIDVSDKELTNESFSLAMDIGIYLGQVVMKNLPGTRWDQEWNKKFADYGQPVITGFDPMTLNPVRIAVTLAYAYAAKEQSGDRLRNLYDIWAKKRL